MQAPINQHNRRAVMFALNALLILFFCARTACGQAGLPKVVRLEQLKEDLARYVYPSAEQIDVITGLHAGYATRWAESFNELIRDFDAKWKRAFTDPRDFVGDSMAIAFQEANAAAENLRSQLRSANDLFFDSIELILSDSQLPGMQRVRLAHDRRCFQRSSRTNQLRERDIDLIEIIEQLDLEGVDHQALSDAINTFEPSFVAHLRHAAEVDQRRLMLQFQAIENVRLNRLHGDDLAGQAENERLSNRADRLALASSRRLVDANRRGLVLFKSILPPATGSELQRRYDERAYPEVFPDPGIATKYFEQARAITGLAPEIVAAIDALRDQYLAEHDRLSRRLAEAIDDQSFLPFKISRDYDGDDFGDAYVAMVVEKQEAASLAVREAGLAREHLNLSQPAKIRALLTPEQVAALPAVQPDAPDPTRPWARLADL